VKALQIDSGAGCVAPTTTTVQNGTYKPLGRELYIYVKQSSLKNNKALAKFIEYYLYHIKGIVKEALFVPLTAAQLKATKEEVERVKNLAD
jgi:phosphate transport system substrate-binding protein